jgi:hypothetical protein
MKKLLAFFCFAFLIACNNQESSPASGNNTTNSSTAVANKLSEQTRFEILAGCVDDIRATAGSNFDSVKTYALCNCMLREMQAKYPTADSTVLVNYLNDTLQVAQVAPRCQ